MSTLFLEHGSLTRVECWQEDVGALEMDLTTAEPYLSVSLRAPQAELDLSGMRQFSLELCHTARPTPYTGIYCGHVLIAFHSTS